MPTLVVTIVENMAVKSSLEGRTTRVAKCRCIARTEHTHRVNYNGNTADSRTPTVPGQCAP